MKSTSIDTSGLKYLDNFSIPVYTSFGGEVRARFIAERTERTIDWLGDLFDLPKIPPLFVLNSDDWGRIALVPQYGLAHVNRTRIVMGQEQSGLWGSVLKTVWPEISRTERERLRSVYGKDLNLEPFTDLVISHELTHLADLPLWLDTATGDRGWGARSPRLLWVSELFANIGLHGYIVEREPESQRALEAVFQVVGGTTPTKWPYHRLHDMYESVAAPGADGINYVWFEFRTQILAKRLWEAKGATGFQQIHRILHGPVLSDEEIFNALSEIDHTVADDIRHWALGDGEPFLP
ncbi:hypothetical protein O3S80_01005 [Streptomyces sp. Lzd4kr]|nr:hypothetical protein [Streptomyces sp. Lzd4kr]